MLGVGRGGFPTSTAETNPFSFSFCCRLRFDVEVRCLQDDPQFPIYDSPVNGYPMHALIDILLKPDIPEERICTVQPLSVTENAAFVVDVERLMT